MEIKDTDINPETGRDRLGRFGAGNQCNAASQRKKRQPRQVAEDVRQYADANNLSLMAIQRLEKIARNERGNYEIKDQIKACDLLIKQFGITVEKDLDREVVEDTNATISEAFEALKAVAVK